MEKGKTGVAEGILISPSQSIGRYITTSRILIPARVHQPKLNPSQSIKDQQTPSSLEKFLILNSYCVKEVLLSNLLIAHSATHNLTHYRPRANEENTLQYPPSSHLLLGMSLCWSVEAGNVVSGVRMADYRSRPSPASQSSNKEGTLRPPNLASPPDKKFTFNGDGGHIINYKTQCVRQAIPAASW